ncbi:hypothetical protein ETB97_008935 [Aspergillus alliaceus]|uniref:S-adenosyl-L-methionine-dependent methyltransferase n=1 Tax=Petromyces alliaceus TaxID=209559 RepID=A0A8H6EAQ0_PETAA|nr:hypothetical protein ETB97_008935 [Aspergillus burnettii]
MAESETTPRRVAFEVDSDSEDLESVESDMTSLTSSIYNYVYENGRTYHSYRPGAYILPNDEREQERLDLLHHVFRLCLDGRLCRTELTNPQKILDVGTGTGIWAIEVADDYPSAEVVGVDLSPIQPGWVAPNLRFFIDDVSQEWTFPSNSFDFIHAEFNRISHANGRVFDLFPQFKGLLGDAAFTNIQVHQEVCPIGTWPKDSRLKEIGRYFRAQFLWGGVEAYSMALFTRFGGWSPEEVEVLLAEVRREVKGNKMHIYTHCSFTTAEKPRN